MFQIIAALTLSSLLIMLWILFLVSMDAAFLDGYFRKKICKRLEGKK